ncbi:MAG: fluoride efflux transporter CrcB [Gammaproteobacteria bacterium]|jgi:fluoride exporter|nr:fluoride efflux transporter CrcB [Gammaproteobacteria bacterium]MBT7603479.1 fluoride efflux transporter CrcB [Gammaproteobacteria bacterium]
MLKLTLIAFGGALGSIGRYYLSSSFLKNFIIFDIPIAILFINILGSFFFGVFMGILQNNILISSNIKIFVVTGFLAAFTTFSTFAWESIILFENQMYLKLTIYCLASVLLSIGFCLIGYYLGK